MNVRRIYDRALRCEHEGRHVFERNWKRVHKPLFESLHDRLFEEYAGLPRGG